jgi:hypothetical protein
MAVETAALIGVAVDEDAEVLLASTNIVHSRSKVSIDEARAAREGLERIVALELKGSLIGMTEHAVAGAAKAEKGEGAV